MNGQKYRDIPEMDWGDWGGGYQSGVDTVLEYIKSLHVYPKLMSELKWAIREGII